MTIQEKFDTLTAENREKLQAVKTEGELDTFLAEAGIEPTAEERAVLSEHLKSKTTAARELSDDEAAEAAGGKKCEKCPKGHWESTGFANFFDPCQDCNVGRCDKFKRCFVRTDSQRWNPEPVYLYKIKCEFFNRTKSYHGPNPSLETNWDGN